MRTRPLRSAAPTLRPTRRWAPTPRATTTVPRRRPAFDPPAILPAKTRGRYIGLALYYPALAAVGLVDVARSVFRLPRSERFGVRAVTLTLFFMTLLGKPTVESAKHLRRAAFGAVVGSGRAPAVKTLRRKLAELVGQNRAGEFGTRLARRWVEAGIVATAYLYVDGHMQEYTGKRRLEKVWNSKRRMPLPGDPQLPRRRRPGPPAAVSDRAAVHQPGQSDAAHRRRDPGGGRRAAVHRRCSTGVATTASSSAGSTRRTSASSPTSGATPTCPPTRSGAASVASKAAGCGSGSPKTKSTVGGSGPWRRIVVRTADGHQTPILTNLGPEVSAARIACLMFARWRQENLFKYMGAHHGLDRLISYGAEAADADTRIPNPERKRLDREIAARRKELAALKASLGDALLDEPKTGSRSAHGLKIAQRGAVRRLRTLEEDIAALVAARKPLPTHVTVAEAGATREVIRLEHKAIVDRIKISAYNAEEWLLDRLIDHYPNPHDVRDLLRSFAELSGEIDTTDARRHRHPRPARHTDPSASAARPRRRPQHHRRHLPRHRRTRHLPASRCTTQRHVA